MGTRQFSNLSTEELTAWKSEANVTDESMQQLDKDAIESRIKRQKPVPPYWKAKYEKECAANWDKFYRRNTTNFFKDRHYLQTEWPQLLVEGIAMFEVGCGVGNTVFPVLKHNPTARIFCCDFAKTAVELVKANPDYQAADGRVVAFQCDITVPDDSETHAEISMARAPMADSSLDVVTMVFVLSALKPDTMRAAVARIAAKMKPGAILLFRDYARHDEAQLRFIEKMGDNYHVRGDGTLAYYFDTEEIEDIMCSAGLVREKLEVMNKEIINRKERIIMHRYWIQATFKKTSSSASPRPSEELSVPKPESQPGTDGAQSRS